MKTSKQLSPASYDQEGFSLPTMKISKAGYAPALVTMPVKGSSASWKVQYVKSISLIRKISSSRKTLVAAISMVTLLWITIIIATVFFS